MTDNRKKNAWFHDANRESFGREPTTSYSTTHTVTHTFRNGQWHQHQSIEHTVTRTYHNLSQEQAAAVSRDFDRRWQAAINPTQPARRPARPLTLRERFDHFLSSLGRR